MIFFRHILGSLLLLLARKLFKALIFGAILLWVVPYLYYFMVMEFAKEFKRTLATTTITKTNEGKVRIR